MSRPHHLCLYARPPQPTLVTCVTFLVVVLVVLLEAVCGPYGPAELQLWGAPSAVPEACFCMLGVRVSRELTAALDRWSHMWLVPRQPVQGWGCLTQGPVGPAVGKIPNPWTLC